MKVLIVEDEPYAQNELKRLLDRTEIEMEILECIDSVEEAVEWFRSNEAPDLIFLDIQLSDGLSFDIFSQVKVKAPVIFTTAYDEYAIQAFKLNSIDYLLKPIKYEELKTALDKLGELSETRITQPDKGGLNVQQIEQLLEIHRPKYKARFIAKVGDQIKHVDVIDVAYFRAEDNEVMLVTNNNNRFIVDYTLDELNALLDPATFFRANRSYIVTVGSIKKISKYFNSRLHLELIPEPDDTVLISRVRVPDFMKWIDQ
ncbi:MAG: response regulator transcription factor [Bacteroidales bacterium]|nr:response regulator transcription factor [Bacteroidales bacterium]